VPAIRQDVGPIYGLVNNAAIGASGRSPNDARLRNRTYRSAQHLSPLVLTKHVVRAMTLKPSTGEGGGSSTSRPVSATGFSGLSVYGAAKAALVGFTKSLARELGPLGITVNAVAPGFVDTAMTDGINGARREQIARHSPLKRLAEIADVAGAVAFLVGDAGRNITVTVLTVDAGSTT
jgi:3-oxoacyl-[acyl-carrier protein] reductase